MKYDKDWMAYHPKLQASESEHYHSRVVPVAPAM